MRELRILRTELEAAVQAGDEQLVNRLMDLLEKQAKRCVALEKRCAEYEKRNQDLEQRIAELEGRDPPADDPSEPSASYSLSAEEKRRRRKELANKTKKKSRKRGRKPKLEKQATVVRWEEIVPEGATRAECQLQSERIVWRIENGRALRVGYKIYRLAWQPTPRIPGVLPRCEYGVEVSVLLGYLVYITNVSIQKACDLLGFFCELPLSASQADVMLTRLGKEWNDDFETICDQLATAAVVYSDETGWPVGRLNHSLWSFTSDLRCVMLFGCRKDRKTLETILPPDTFTGCLVSDDASVYQRGYRSQKCWAHLIRKAIKLAILHPGNETYQQFLNQLLELFHDSKSIASDQQLGAREREKHVCQLEARLCDFCHPHWPTITSSLGEAKDESEQKFRNLVSELLRLMVDKQLFEFVLSPEVDPTNNLSERQLRSAALARKAARTNKTDTGSHRQTRIVSVLESLRRCMVTFTIQSVLDQVADSMKHATGIFSKPRPPELSMG